MKRVLITGASGFIGRQVSGMLHARGYEVHGVSSRPRTGGVDLCWHHVDLCDDGATRRLLTEVRPSHLLHLAWYAEPGRFWSAPENLHWVKASLNLVEAFVEAGGGRFVGAGSAAEYDWNVSPCSETRSAINPDTLYGTAKHALHLILKAYASNTGIGLAWGRIFWVYGPGEDSSRLIPTLIRAVLAGRTATCRNGDLIRDYLHATDVAAAFAALVDSDVQGVANIGSGTGTRLGEIATIIGGTLDRPDLIAVGSAGANKDGPPTVVAEVKQLRELGWHAMFSLNAGLADTIAWWAQQPR